MDEDVKKELIDKILEKFDFDKVHDVMEKLSWNWATVGIPSTYQIIKQAKELLYEVSELENLSHVATGGFRATKIDDEQLELSFEICNETAWVGDEEQ